MPWDLGLETDGTVLFAALLRSPVFGSLMLDLLIDQEYRVCMTRLLCCAYSKSYGGFLKCFSRTFASSKPRNESFFCQEFELKRVVIAAMLNLDFGHRKHCKSPGMRLGLARVPCKHLLT